jgi:hypothetical protein
VKSLLDAAKAGLVASAASNPSERRAMTTKHPVTRRAATRRSTVVASAAALLGLAALPGTAHADNNITLQRFGTCNYIAPVNNYCTGVTRDDAGFRRFARDLGLVISPKAATTAETTGVAGFVFQIDQTWNAIDSGEEHWKKADAEQDPADTLSTTQIHVRKGLPFSFEIGTILTLLSDSKLMGVGAEGRWALHEDYLWPVPDLAVRGAVTSLLGSNQLVLTTVQADVTAGLPFGVGSVMNITPFAGYSLVVPISASRLIDTTPGDARPPVDSATGDDNQPEFAFGLETDTVNTGVAGMRFQWALVDVTLQGQFSPHVKSYTASLGLDF